MLCAPRSAVASWASICSSLSWHLPHRASAVRPRRPKPRGGNRLLEALEMLEERAVMARHPDQRSDLALHVLARPGPIGAPALHNPLVLPGVGDQRGQQLLAVE